MSYKEFAVSDSLDNQDGRAFSPWKEFWVTSCGKQVQSWDFDLEPKNWLHDQ